MTYQTNRPITSHTFSTTAGGNPMGEPWTLPQGASVSIVKGFHGGTRDAFVVADVALLKQLSGNSHDPTYRYMMVNPYCVSGDTEAEDSTIDRLVSEHNQSGGGAPTEQGV